MLYFTLALPQFTDEHHSWIEAVRAQHDPQHTLVPGHITLGFAMQADEASYVRHVQHVAATTSSIPLCFKHAMVSNDIGGQKFHSFLVPDEGFAAVSRLYDRLYSADWETLRRFDVPYVPHITVGTAANAHTMQNLCNRLNAENFVMPGHIHTVHVCSLAEGKLHFLHQIALR